MDSEGFAVSVKELRNLSIEVSIMKNWGAVFLCVGLGLLSGSIVGGLERWTLSGPAGGDPLDLVLGLGFLGLFPGLLWARLERSLQDRSGGRRRLLLYSLLGQLLVGGACGLLLAGITVSFAQVMTTLGFQSVAGNPAKAFGLGMMYASLPGLGLGYLAALARSFFWRPRTGG